MNRHGLKKSKKGITRNIETTKNNLEKLKQQLSKKRSPYKTRELQKINNQQHKKLKRLLNTNKNITRQIKRGKKWPKKTTKKQ